MEEDYVDIQPDDLLEITLKEPDDFLKVRETLTRIGVASRKEKKLFQSCHILHKQGRYFIVHFKELFLLDSKKANLEETDIERIESGLVSYGADTDDATNPFEMGLGKFMDIDQPHDFVGKTALKDIRDKGTTRRFMGLMIDGAPFAGTNEQWWDLTSDGSYAGYASASAYSPRAQSNIAVAMVNTDVIDAGVQVAVHIESGVRTADVVQLPII